MANLYDLLSSDTPMFNGQTLPEDEVLMEEALEELEEELARLLRQRDDLLFAGKFKQAQDLDSRITEVEDLIAGSESI